MPQALLVAVDDGVAQRALDLFDRFDLGGVGESRKMPSASLRSCLRGKLRLRLA